MLIETLQFLNASMMLHSASDVPNVLSIQVADS
jgi:hypothetical protein